MFLSKRFTYSGDDTLVVVEIIRELQAYLNGPTTDSQSGAIETEG
jgi:hypothetical protein